MIRAIEPRVCAQMQEVGFFDALEKILTIVLLSFLFVAVADTLSNAQTASKDPTNPFQPYTQASATSSLSYVDNSQSGNFLSLAARWGMATCWGSNGPSPVHVCLTDEMGIGFNSFYGFNASLNFIDRNDYGAVIAADINRLQFHGNGTVTDTELARRYTLVIGDSLSGDNTTTIVSLNSDFHLGSILETHTLKFFPRVQFVDYIQDMSLTNHTQHWADSGASRYTLLGVGGVVELDHLPFWTGPAPDTFGSVLSPGLRLSGTIGTGGHGVSYWSWNIALKFLKFGNSALRFANRDTQIWVEAGISMWQILEPPARHETHWRDMGRVDTMMFYLQGSAVF